MESRESKGSNLGVLLACSQLLMHAVSLKQAIRAVHPPVPQTCRRHLHFFALLATRNILCFLHSATVPCRLSGFRPEAFSAKVTEPTSEPRFSAM